MQQQHNEQLQQFWAQQLEEVMNVQADPNEFKNHQLPLARIKKIMKSDEDVRMISAEAPVLFAKACELFILELTLRSWMHSEESKRRTLQRNDIAAAITKTDVFDFLLDIVPREEAKECAGARAGADDGGSRHVRTGNAVRVHARPWGWRRLHSHERCYAAADVLAVQRTGTVPTHHRCTTRKKA